METAQCHCQCQDNCGNPGLQQERHKGYQVREPEEDILDKVESEINDWNIKVREALETKLRDYLEIFPKRGGGGVFPIPKTFVILP